ncbi:MAG: hypothetical protein AB7P04_06915 [Bacteriovoracia bacterium]
MKKLKALLTLALACALIVSGCAPVVKTGGGSSTGNPVVSVPMPIRFAPFTYTGAVRMDQAIHLADGSATPADGSSPRRLDASLCISGISLRPARPSALPRLDADSGHFTAIDSIVQEEDDSPESGTEEAEEMVPIYTNDRVQSVTHLDPAGTRVATGQAPVGAYDQLTLTLDSGLCPEFRGSLRVANDRGEFTSGLRYTIRFSGYVEVLSQGQAITLANPGMINGMYTLTSASHFTRVTAIPGSFTVRRAGPGVPLDDGPGGRQPMGGP